MYPPSQDAVFARSVSGKIWPRAAVAAGSYWHFTNASFDTLQPEFEAVTATHLTILYVRNEVLAVAYALVHMSGSMLLGRMTQMIM